MKKFPLCGVFIALLFSVALVQTASAQNIGTALVNGAPQINSGRVEGNVQQMTGVNATLNSGAVITGDLLVPGTPTLIKNGQYTFGGVIVGTGSASPSNYQVILNGSVTLGHLRTRTNPVAIPAWPPVPSPTGTRTVTITAAGQSAGSFATLRNFTLNGNVGQYAVPPGTYGDFIANAASGFTLGVAGSTQPAIYNLQHLTLNGATKLLVVGPVILNVANGFTANGTAGTSANPAWLKLNIVTGGFTVNGGCTLYGYATAPNGTLIINGAAKLIGGASCNALTINANGLLQLFDAGSFENKSPTVAITSPAADTVFNTGTAITLVASAADPDGSVSKVEFFAGTTKLGEATSSPWTYAWQNAAAGSYQLTAIATDNLGAKTTSVAVPIRVNTPPTVALTAPANQSVFPPGGVITLTANAADSDGTIQKVEFFSDGTKLGEKTSIPYSFSWNGAATGPHALTARATDNNGAQTSSAAVNIRVNAAPAATMTAPANGSVVQAGSVIPLAANASDSDGTIAKVEFYAGATKIGEDSTAPYQFNWNNAAAGSYSLTARAIDNDGAQGTSTPINLTINAPPAVAITAPAAAQVFNSGATISITASPTDPDGTVTKVEFFADGLKLGEKATAPYSFGWNTASVGPHVLTARATDNNGAQTSSAAVNIRVNAAPSATMTAPANGSVVQAGSMIPLAANASDSDGAIAKVEFYAGATKVGEDTAAPYQFNWSNAAAGHYALTVRAIDNDGAQGTSAPINLTINAPPAVAITAPAAAQVFNSGATISITANPSDPDGTVMKAEFFSGATKIGEASAVPWTISWPAPAPGLYQLSAVATDDLGAQATSAVVSVRINAPPTVTITSPADQAVVQPGNPIPLTVNAIDSDGTITKVEFFAGGTKLGESSSAPFNFSWSNAISGSYTITAKATDNAAASAVSAPIHLRVNALPVVALTAPAQGATYRAGDAIPVSANATDSDDGITKVEFFTGGTKIGEASAAPYSVNWTGAPEGASTLTARATDGSGASATSAAVTINVARINTQLTVDAGPDRLISLPGSAALEGQVLSNGGTPGPDVVLAWSVVSGPGAVTFSTPNSSATSAAFTQPGNYIIQLTASNADGANFDTAAVTVLSAPQPDADSSVSNRGREFWMAFLSGLRPSYEKEHCEASLTISSEVPATGTVEIFSTYVFNGVQQTDREVRNFTVPAGGNTLVSIAKVFSLRYEDQLDQSLPTSIHIQSDQPVAVQALAADDATTDGTVVLPNGLLGRDHFLMSYRNGLHFVPNGGVIGGTQFAVVAAKPQTQVIITPTVASAAHPAGQPFTITMQQGEVYRLLNQTDAQADFTGTRVQSDKPVAVFAGSILATIPAGTAAADHLFEQMPPVDLWGRHFVTMPLKTRHNGDRFRMLAANNGTHVSVNGGIVATLNRGEFFETVLSDPSSVLSDQPILLAQFAHSSGYDNATGDPFLSLVPPYETFGRHYILSTAEVYNYYQHQYVDLYDSYLNLVVDSAHAAEVTVNGQPIDLAEFVTIGDSGFSGASIHLPKNSTLDISAPTPIGTLLYGWAPYESYGYTGGLYAARDNSSVQFDLTQSSDQAPVGSTHHVTARLINGSGLPVQDALVTLSVTGANLITGSGYTSPDGTIEFSWQGTHTGNDLVTVTTGGRTATVNVTWVPAGANQPPQVNVGSDVVLKLGQPLSLHGLVQDDGIPAGQQLTLAWSALSGLGDVTFSNPSASDTIATFLYPGQYKIRLSAFDGQFTGDDDLSVLVDIPPQFVYEMLVPSADAVDVGKEWSVGVTGWDRDGVIARIDLIEGSQVLGTLEPNTARVFYYWSSFSTVFNTVGTHTLTVRLTDDLGITEERSINVVVRPVPTVQILTPASGVTVAAGGSVTFTASASSTGGSITRVAYTDVTDYYPFEIGDGTGSNYQFNWTPSWAGTRQIAAVAYDSNGASDTSAPVTIDVLSPGDPTITITSPENGGTIYRTYTTMLHAEASAVAPATVDEVDFFDGNQYLGSSFGAPFQKPWTPTTTGPHTLRAEVYDTFGGYASTSITVNVVAIPRLNVTLVEPTPNLPVKVNTPIALFATIENVLGTLEEVDFSVNGQYIGSDLGGSMTWTPTTVGEYEIEVDAYGRDPGQNGSVTAIISVADLHSPFVQFTAPANNSTSPPGTPIVLQAQASDIDSNLAKVQFLADGLLLSDTPLSGSAGVASFTWDNAGPGWHNLSAVAVDDTIQSGNASLRVFVERPVTNDLLPPTALTSKATSPTATHLMWAPSTTTNSVDTAIERRAGLNGVWQEIATVDPNLATYEDNALESESYYSYRLTSLDAAGARSIYSQESSATTLVQLPQYAVVDLGESLEQSLVALNLVEKRFLYAQAVGPFPSAALLDLRDAEVMSIGENNDVLLKQRATTSDGQTTIEYYLLWHPDPAKTPDSIGIPNFRAFRLTRDGIVVGSMDHSTIGQGVPDWIYQGFEFWFGVGSRPGVVHEGSGKIDVRAATWTPAGGIKEITGDEANEYRFDRLDLNPARKFPKPYDSLFLSLGYQQRWDRGGNGIVGDLRNINSNASLDTIPSYEFYLFQHGMRWKNNKWDTLGSLRRASTSEGESIATAISPDGKVTVGSSAAPDRAGDPPSPTHAMRSLMTFNASQTTPGDPILQDLLPLGSGSYAWAWDVDAAGNAVGYSTKGQSDPVYRTHAVWWQSNSTAPLELPNLGGRDATYFPEGHGYASAINARGDRIVGKSLTMEQFTAGTVWALNAGNGGNSRSWEVHDLNAHVPSDWFVVNALDVNDKGFIVGTAFHTVPDPVNPTGPKIQVRRGVLLVPIEFVEATPKTKDEAGNEIAGSEKPKPRPESNELIEEPRSGEIPNVAYRNLKVRLPHSSAGDKIKWSMTPLFTPAGQSEPRFRGQWPQEHADRFEANAGAGGGYGFERLSQEEASTQVDANGDTVVRINLPPIGFNKAGVRLEIEKYPGATAEIVFEVPAVVVVDPGHGGYDPTGGSSPNNAVSYGDSQGHKTDEKVLTLLFGKQLAQRLATIRDESGLLLRVLLTRSTDNNIGIAARSRVARVNGADIFLSIHFNGSTNTAIHGPEVLMEPAAAGNINYDEDHLFAESIQTALDNSVPNAQSPGTQGYRGIKENTNSGVYRDNYLGNRRNEINSRACLAEIDWITNPNVETNLISGSSASVNQEAVVNALGDAVIQDLQSQP